VEQLEQSKNRVLEVKDLNISYSLRDKLLLPACLDVKFDLERGESIGILGESGAGKSTVAYALMGLIEPPNKVTGKVVYAGRNVLKLNQRDLRKYRWNEIAMIFQAAMNSLDPIATVGKNMRELILDKRTARSKAEAKKLALKLLDLVGLSEEVYDMYPFELSGGMKQRVIIAMSLVTDPKILILDEPTTALDTITQYSVLSTIKSLKKEGRIGTIILISHDISVQAFMVDRVLVMLKGYVVEDTPIKEMLEDAKHPYSQVLTGKLKMNASEKVISKTSAGISSARGCPFSAFCPYVMQKCNVDMPPLVSIGGGHRVACYLYGG
jgi:peptide/nickel transport system ATP-binding protein